MQSKQQVGWCALALSLAIVSVGTLRAGDDDEISKATKSVNGVWKRVSLIEDGQPAPDEEHQGVLMTLRDGKWTTKRNDEVVSEGTFKIVAIKNGVRQVEAIVEKGENAGATGKHISKIEGDKLTVCRTSDSKELPTEFTSQLGSGQVLVVWMRDQPQDR
jgi:uncharacterized protein (TIGR03067 family)